MKKLLLALLILGFSLPAIGQRKSTETVFFQKLSLQKNVSADIKAASLGISRNLGGGVNLDSVTIFTQTFENAVLSGQSAGSVKPAVVKSALKKYPGTSKEAVNSRLKLYAMEPR